MNVASIRLVATREIRERGRSTALRVATVISLLVVTAAAAIPALRKGHHPTYHVGVVGQLSKPIEDSVVRAGAALGATVKLQPEPSEAAAAADLQGNRIDVAVIGVQRLLVKSANEATRGSTSTKAVFVASVAEAVSIQSALEHNGIPPGQAAALAHAPPLLVASLHPARRDGTQRLTAFYGVLLLYLLVQQYGYWLLLGVVEEKSTRVVEVLLATIKPVELLIGKAVGIGLLALTQAIISVVITLAGAAALMRTAGTVYTRAILRTGRRIKLREVLRAPAG